MVTPVVVVEAVNMPGFWGGSGTVNFVGKISEEHWVSERLTGLGESGLAGVMDTHYTGVY